jgi:hypothetical protein
MPNQQLSEGLRPLDLSEMVLDTLSIDTFRSKMGEDRDICVLSLKIKDRNPAKDLMEFIEKTFDYVLDADVSSGEDNKGQYSVFVELSRTPRLAEQIKDITYGIRKLTGIEEFKFKYYKDNSVIAVTEDNLKSKIPLSAADYDSYLNKIQVESIKRFFNKTLMDDLTLENSIITIHKPFDQKIQMRWLNEDDPQAVVEGAMSIDTDATAEIFWLTKVLGDYDISKFGDKFLFTNGGEAILLQRID